MKTLLKHLLTLTLICTCFYSNAQQPVTGAPRLGLGKMDSYKVEITYNKTTHLIFPAAIRYVDLGSEYLIAGKAEDAENVLRVKASASDFQGETNFSVITDDGSFYTFDVRYNPNPATMNYNLEKMQKAEDRETGDSVLFEDLGHNSPQMAGLVMETIYNQNKKTVNHIGSRSYGILFLLKGIYIHNGKFYFHTELRNQSNLPFTVDFIKFKVADKKLARRTVVQERPLKPLRIYKPLHEVAGNATERNVFLLDQFTMASDKILLIEIFEKNGGRHQVLQVQNQDLVRAALIKNMHLKMK